MNRHILWIIGIALSLALATATGCSKSGDSTESSGDKADESASNQAKSKAVAAGDKAKSSSEAESDQCPGVCKRCYEAVVSGCEQCSEDRDCDSPEDPCMTAKLLADQVGCGTCASSLGRETATDDCDDD
jgi:hypothetical protein